jgi:hypothetical protein
MLSRGEIEEGLTQFHGTTCYSRFQRGFLLTEGAKWLAESAGYYWLYDIAWSVKPILAKGWFASLTLTVDLDAQTGEVVITDGHDRVLYKQRVPFTDFPLPEVKLFIADDEAGEKVIMLPGEY